MKRGAADALKATQPLILAGTRLGQLDGLRGFAVVAVILFHTGLLAGGFLGVDLFFALSGFVITSGLLREVNATGAVNFLQFLGRRARRLLPAFFVFIVGVLIAVTLLANENVRLFAIDDTPWVLAQLVNWHFIAEHIDYGDGTQLHVFAHLWSIAVEWQFYLVWPIVIAVASQFRRHGPAVLIVAAVAAVGSALLMLHLGPLNATRAYEGTDTRACALLLGAVAATDVVRGAVTAIPRRIAACALVVLLVAMTAMWITTPGTQVVWLYRGGLAAHSVMAAAAIVLLATHPRLVASQAVGSRVPRWLGGNSYSVYLWHWPIVVLLPVWSGAGGTAARAAVILAGALLLGWASTRWVETPFRERRRWSQGWRGTCLVVLATAVTVVTWLFVPRPDIGAGTVDLDGL